MTNETPNEKNYRILRNRLIIEGNITNYIEKYGSKFVIDTNNKDDVKLEIISEHGLIPVLGDETLHLIEKDLDKIGLGVGEKLENHPYKKFENEIWFTFEKKMEFVNENENKNGNGFENENENENRNENENENGIENAIQHLRKLKTLI